MTLRGSMVIMRDLYDLGLRGRLPMFIKKNFLFERTFWVRVGSTFSDLQHQEEGVSLGSIPSVTLFSIKIKVIFMIVSQLVVAKNKLIISFSSPYFFFSFLFLNLYNLLL